MVTAPGPIPPRSVEHGCRRRELELLLDLRKHLVNEGAHLGGPPQPHQLRDGLDHREADEVAESDRSLPQRVPGDSRWKNDATENSLNRGRQR